ncbi:YHS domain-containing (seleno)protein [Dinoroseobacter sp. PD6]|uniref:YHS domain-containing (seleno)protein n=1 Tax=Dinoroseobacter sp. PD6 TaxID=3028384 RepID=UPI00237BC079|nr:YHS domain-containing (seleno)protein [Dinoroseobacter sp. PD6]MDD9717730.1 YHS domain-containing (seleno)protein [Dinoroseobacter sp. PD6]
MLTKRQFLIGTATALAAAPLAAPALAAEPPVFSDRGAAIRGYDPVAYFTLGEPTEGSDAFTHDWNGATWRFASDAHRAAFAADPVAYAPQFGGYCAWAVAEGYTASTIPEAWRIVDGKLYMNFSRRVQRRWERDIPGNIARGNANWPQVLA